MQHLRMLLLSALLGASPAFLSHALAEEAPAQEPPVELIAPAPAAEKDPKVDTEACTVQSNARAQERDGDAASLFFECMAQKGYTKDALDDLADEQ